MSEQALNLPQEEPQDFGFGSKVSRRLRLRLLNPDGTFNVRAITALPGLDRLVTISPARRLAQHR